MPVKTETCAACGHPKADHTHTKQECPVGRKHRSMGYAQFGPGTFTPKPITPRNRRDSQKLAEDLDEQIANLDQPDTDADVAQANRLARLFYRMHGYVVAPGYDFANASHPQEVLIYTMAVVAINHTRENA